MPGIIKTTLPYPGGLETEWQLKWETSTSKLHLKPCMEEIMHSQKLQKTCSYTVYRLFIGHTKFT